MDATETVARDRRVRVTIGIPTFRRPIDLARLLDRLPAVVQAAEASGDLQVDVLVVDNDPRGSARHVVAGAPVDARYVSEARPGVAAVRNRVLEECDASDLLAFIDDDETPQDDRWLAALVATRASFGAHVVAGPVRTVVEGGLDPWIAAGDFYARAHRAKTRTGDQIVRAATNNLLLDLGFVRSRAVRFDERFGLSGGEDSLFTSMLHGLGARMVWCRDAVVLDHLPKERQTREHALQRVRGMASAGVRVAVALSPSRWHALMVRGRAIMSGVFRGMRGAVYVGWGRVRHSQVADAVGQRELMRAFGAIEGACGRVNITYGA